MTKETIIGILNTLNQIEVKGFQNVNYMCGVMNVLRDELNKHNEVGGEDGTTKQ